MEKKLEAGDLTSPAFCDFDELPVIVHVGFSSIFHVMVDVVSGGVYGLGIEPFIDRAIQEHPWKKKS